MSTNVRSWPLLMEGGGAYLGPISWVVHNSCLGFLGEVGDTLPCREMIGGVGGWGTPGKMPGNVNLFHGD